MPPPDPLNPYRESVRQNGTGFSATLWANKRSQRLRFETFTQMVCLPGKRVLDAGCSRGDLAAYLIEHGVGYEQYIGIDGVAEVIDAANARRLPRCAFHHGDLLADPALLRTGDPHVITVSGTLNTMTDGQAVALLDAAWEATGQTLVFNFLSARAGRRAPGQLPPARRIDPLKLMDWALRRTWHVALRQDYFEHGHDATICMRKP